MFAKAGIGPPASFDALMAPAAKIGAGDSTGFLTLNFDWLYWPLFAMNGVDLLTPDLKKTAFNTPEMAAECVDQLAKRTQGSGVNKISWTGRWVEPLGAFASGNVGMLHAHSAGVFLRQGPGTVDQRRYARRRRGAGILVDADASRLGDLQGLARTPIWPGPSSTTSRRPASQAARDGADAHPADSNTEVDKSC